MDIQRLMAAQMHNSITVQQALSSPLVTPDDNLRQCKRRGCFNWFPIKGCQQYCGDPECRYLHSVDQARLKNARKKQRRAA